MARTGVPAASSPRTIRRPFVPVAPVTRIIGADELSPETVVHVVHVAGRAADPLEQHPRLRAVMRPVVDHVRDELREHHLVRVALGVLVGDYAIGARIGQRLDERAEVCVGLSVGLAPRALDRIGASWRRLAFPTGEPDPRRPEHVMQVAGDRAEVRVDRPGELLRHDPVDRRQNLVVCPLVVRDELPQLVAVGQLSYPSWICIYIRAAAPSPLYLEMTSLRQSMSSKRAVLP